MLFVSFIYHCMYQVNATLESIETSLKNITKSSSSHIFLWQFILLIIIKNYEYYNVIFLCSYYSTKAVFLALGITVVVTVAVTVFCFQTKVGYTYHLYTISMTLRHCVNVFYHAFLFFYRWISLNVQGFSVSLESQCL